MIEWNGVNLCVVTKLKPSLMKVITREQIILAYELSRDYYEGNIERKDAISNLRKAGMNVGSAAIYLQVYARLKDGDTFTRTLNAESFDYFLNRMLKFVIFVLRTIMGKLEKVLLKLITFFSNFSTYRGNASKN